MQNLSEPAAVKHYKWKDCPDRQRAYFRQYYHDHKTLKGTGEKPNIDWKDKDAVRAHKRSYPVKRVECPLCLVSCRASSWPGHCKSRRHQLAVRLTSKNE